MASFASAAASPADNAVQLPVKLAPARSERANGNAWRLEPRANLVGLSSEQVDGKHSYVRAHLSATNRVEFTLFVVSPDDRISPMTTT